MAKELGKNERSFDVVPRGIAYICEFCGEGDMVYTGEHKAPYPDAPKTVPFMFQHQCSKCGKMMLLPKVYPYIDWNPA